MALNLEEAWQLDEHWNYKAHYTTTFFASEAVTLSNQPGGFNGNYSQTCCNYPSKWVDNSIKDTSCPKIFSFISVSFNTSCIFLSLAYFHRLLCYFWLNYTANITLFKSDCSLQPKISRLCLQHPLLFTTLHWLSNRLSLCLSSPAASMPRHCHLPSVHQMPSDFPSFPHHLTAPPIFTPVPTSLICSAVAWPSSPATSLASHSLIGHSLHVPVYFHSSLVKVALSSLSDHDLVPVLLLEPACKPFLINKSLKLPSWPRLPVLRSFPCCRSPSASFKNWKILELIETFKSSLFFMQWKIYSILCLILHQTILHYMWILICSGNCSHIFNAISSRCAGSN